MQRNCQPNTESRVVNASRCRRRLAGPSEPSDLLGSAVGLWSSAPSLASNTHPRADHLLDAYSRTFPVSRPAELAAEAVLESGTYARLGPALHRVTTAAAPRTDGERSSGTYARPCGLRRDPRPANRNRKRNRKHRSSDGLGTQPFVRMCVDEGHESS